MSAAQAVHWAGIDQTQLPGAPMVSETAASSSGTMPSGGFVVEGPGNG
jgi:hypothetical protein